MQARIWSDIHNEFGVLKVTPRDDDADTVLLIAGDFMVWEYEREQMLEKLKELCTQFKAVVYIAGNHEFYGSPVEEVINGLRDFASSIPNMYFLDGDCVYVDGVRFIGGTLWTNFDNGDAQVMRLCQRAMNDYRQVTHRDREGDLVRIDAQYILDRNTWYRAQLEKWLAEPFDGKTVVLSHHLPDVKFAQNYGGGDLDFAYGNTDMEKFFTPIVNLWIHGHAHIRQEYTINDVPVVANPRGYYGHQSMAYTFEDDKVWQV